MVSRKCETDWTPELISNFFGWRARKLSHENHFSYTWGEGIVNLLKITGNLGGNVLDYGCGPGYLIGYLLREDVNCYGIDVSREAIDLTNERYKTNKKCQGAIKIDSLPSPFDDNFFDVITCIETLEHLSGEDLLAVTHEIRRILKPGGIALFATPYAEDLEKSMIYCPFCDSEFHNAQHLRSFDVNSLRQVLTANDFTVLFCQHLNLRDFQSNSRLHKSRGGRMLRSYYYSQDFYLHSKNKLNRLLDTVCHTRFPFKREILKQSGKGPHLCAIATKK
jgi:SAM-dependent methyltransferase